MFVAALVVAFLPADESHADDFVDTRLTFTLGDDDLGGGRATSLPDAPGFAAVDDPAFNLFFDNLNTRFTGRENLTHLVLYQEMPAFADDVTTEAALVLRLDFRTFRPNDTGSYLRLRWNPFNDAPDDGLNVTLFPFNAQRMRVGHLWDTSIGGDEFLRDSVFVNSPGGRVDFRRGIVFAWAGFKATPDEGIEAIDLESSPGEALTFNASTTQFAALGGIGVDLAGDTLRVEATGGWFQRGEGVFVDGGLDPVAARLAQWAVNARVAYHRHMGLTPSIDTQLYTNDPNAPLQLFRQPEYVPGRLGYLLQAEGTFTRQDVLAATGLSEETGLAGSAQFRLQWGYLRAEVTGMYRDARYVLSSLENTVPLRFGVGQTTNPERFVALAVDYHFPRPHITIAGSFGVRHLAAIRGSDAGGSYVLVLRPEGTASVLRGMEPTLVYAARVRARIDISEMLFVNAWVQYVRDGNSPVVSAAGANGSRDIRQQANRVGLGVSASARF